MSEWGFGAVDGSVQWTHLKHLRCRLRREETKVFKAETAKDAMRWVIDLVSCSVGRSVDTVEPDVSIGAGQSLPQHLVRST